MEKRKAVELARKVNEVMSRLKGMDEERREEFVESVLDWIVKMFDDIQRAMAEGGVIKASRVANAYREQLKDIEKKATAIACLTYAIKERYQGKLSPLFVGVLGLV